MVAQCVCSPLSHRRFAPKKKRGLFFLLDLLEGWFSPTLRACVSDERRDKKSFGKRPAAVCCFVTLSRLPKMNS